MYCITQISYCLHLLYDLEGKMKILNIRNLVNLIHIDVVSLDFVMFPQVTHRLTYVVGNKFIFMKSK